MRANRTYEIIIYISSKNPETALANAKHLVDVNCKNKNLRYRYNKMIKESRERNNLYNNDNNNPMFPVIFGMATNIVEGERSRKLHNVREDGVYYCVPVTHFVEDLKKNDGIFYYHRVEAVGNLQEINDDDFLEYIETNIFMNVND